MIARIRSFWLDVNSSYWFYPAIFSLVALAMSFVTVYLDRNGAAEWLNQFDWMHPARPEGARSVLTIIAGSMIGVASTVFSITIAAVAYASGNYGPRLLTNFMQDKGNQLSLGVFIATFVYAMMVLRVVRGEDERAASATDAAATQLAGFVPQLSLLTAVGMALFAVAVLVYFLHHIPSSIRINTVLEGIGERLLRQLKTRFPKDYDPDEPEAAGKGEPVIADKAGYVKIIDFSGLEDIAKSHEARIALKIRTGDFIHADLPVAEIIGADVSEDISADVLACLDLGGMRTPTQDLEFLMDELAEIAMRALSPGINDPFTAITSMHWLSAATAELGRRDLDRGPEQQEYEREYLLPLDDDFAHFVKRGFGVIRADCATNSLASINYIDCLYATATGCQSSKRRRILFEEGKKLLDQAKHSLQGPSMDELKKRFGNFRETMDKMGI